jgi:hypothetical protein
MTREESTIQALRNHIESLEETIRALKKESCEDTAKAFQFGLALGFGEKYDEMDKVMEEVKKAVTPTRKKGKWIEERDDYGELTGWHCSNCYDETGFVTTCAWDYCPNCGAEMEDADDSNQRYENAKELW